MGGFLKIDVKALRHGREAYVLQSRTNAAGKTTSWFYDPLGRRVRTRAGSNWVRAEQLVTLANYGIELQNEQLDAGLGSDGLPMPPLKASGKMHPKFLYRRNGVAVFGQAGYAGWKQVQGLQPIRDLWGEGKGGHLRNDIRINYVDDRQARISITNDLSRKKALMNERRTPWWGWSPASVEKLQAMAASVFGQGMAEYLVAGGLISANYMTTLAKELNRKYGHAFWGGYGPAWERANQRRQLYGRAA